MALKFKVTSHGNDGMLTLDKNKSRFHKVLYQKERPTIDFFRTISGRLTHPQVVEWLTDLSGKTSCCIEAYRDGEQWHQKYWEQLYKVGCIKLPDWKHEEEYRLLCDDFFYSLDTPEKRKAQYSFDDLEGVVFGAKTSRDDKIAIMKIIDVKCQEEQRTDFKFYQAEYDEETGAMKCAELSRLKISVNNAA